MQEFAGRHNIHTDHAKDQMASVAAGIVGRRLIYRDLIAKSENPLDARSDVFQAASVLSVPSRVASASDDGSVLRVQGSSAG